MKGESESMKLTDLNPAEFAGNPSVAYHSPAEGLDISLELADVFASLEGLVSGIPEVSFETPQDAGASVRREGVAALRRAKKDVRGLLVEAVRAHLQARAEGLDLDADRAQVEEGVMGLVKLPAPSTADQAAWYASELGGFTTQLRITTLAMWAAIEAHRSARIEAQRHENHVRDASRLVVGDARVVAYDQVMAELQGKLDALQNAQRRMQFELRPFRAQAANPEAPAEQRRVAKASVAWLEGKLSELPGAIKSTESAIETVTAKRAEVVRLLAEALVARKA